MSPDGDSALYSAPLPYVKSVPSNPSVIVGIAPTEASALNEVKEPDTILTPPISFSLPVKPKSAPSLAKLTKQSMGVPETPFAIISFSLVPANPLTYIETSMLALGASRMILSTAPRSPNWSTSSRVTSSP